MKKVKYKIILESNCDCEYSIRLQLQDDELLIISYAKRGDFEEQIMPSVIFGVPIEKLNAFCEVFNHFKKVALDQCFVGDNRADDYFVSNHVDRQGYNVSVYDISK